MSTPPNLQVGMDYAAGFDEIEELQRMLLSEENANGGSLPEAAICLDRGMQGPAEAAGAAAAGKPPGAPAAAATAVVRQALNRRCGEQTLGRAPPLERSPVRTWSCPHPTLHALNDALNTAGHPATGPPLAAGGSPTQDLGLRSLSSHGVLPMTESGGTAQAMLPVGASSVEPCRSQQSQRLLGEGDKTWGTCCPQGVENQGSLADWVPGAHDPSTFSNPCATVMGNPSSGGLSGTSGPPGLRLQDLNPQGAPRPHLKELMRLNAELVLKTRLTEAYRAGLKDAFHLLESRSEVRAAALPRTAATLGLSLVLSLGHQGKVSLGQQGGRVDIQGPFPSSNSSMSAFSGHTLGCRGCSSRSCWTHPQQGLSVL